MREFTLTLCIFLCFAVSITSGQPRTLIKRAAPDEQKLIDYLKNEYEVKSSEIVFKLNTASWNVETDLNNKTASELLQNETLQAAKFTKDAWETHFKGLKPDDFKDPILKRQILFLSVLGSSALEEKKLSELTDVRTRMSNIYGTAKLCPYKKQDCDISKEGLALDPDLTEILAKSTDYDELEYVWTKWRAATGQKMRKDYKTYVDLSNEAARLNNFKDMGEEWRNDYESETFAKDMDDLWEELKPLYDELHLYVLKKLQTRYPQIKDDKDGLIPAHLLGNMWAQSWIHLYDFVKPYSNASVVDVTKELKEQGYTALKMFETSNDFYLSLGLEPNDISYNESAGAVIQKPKDKEIVCHASAWDFGNKKDFRIKMCTSVNQEDFITVHHEMGHIQYYLLYKDLPITLRSGANPGFHEAVGDTIALSVSTPQHLQKIGLLKNYEETKEAAINALMEMALERVAFLPFGLLIDKWRWDVFSGNAAENEWNAKWWEYREKIQKVKAPNKRTENDFDPGAKYHVPGDSQYMAYFFAHVLEFQLHRALCIEAGEYKPSDPTSKPLHKCDIYQSKKAGEKLRAGLSLGASKHWTIALKEITGETKLSGAAILEYFDPLLKYLREQNSQLKTDARRDEPQVEADDQHIPIIVGGVVGALAVIGIGMYLYMRKKN